MQEAIVLPQSDQLIEDSQNLIESTGDIGGTGGTALPSGETPLLQATIALAVAVRNFKRMHSERPPLTAPPFRSSTHHDEEDPGTGGTKMQGFQKAMHEQVQKFFRSGRFLQQQKNQILHELQVIRGDKGKPLPMGEELLELLRRERKLRELRELLDTAICMIEEERYLKTGVPKPPPKSISSTQFHHHHPSPYRYPKPPPPPKTDFEVFADMVGWETPGDVQENFEVFIEWNAEQEKAREKASSVSNAQEPVYPEEIIPLRIPPEDDKPHQEATSCSSGNRKCKFPPVPKKNPGPPPSPMEMAKANPVPGERPPKSTSYIGWRGDWKAKAQSHTEGHELERLTHTMED